MGFIENLRNTLQMQKEKELAVEKRASKAWETRETAEERAIKRARACLEASSFPSLAKELSEFIGVGVHIATREIAGHSSNDLVNAHEEEAVGKADSFKGYEWGSRPRRVKPYICMEINWDYEHARVSYSGHGSFGGTIDGFKYKHIGIHFEEDWKIYVIGSSIGSSIGSPTGVTTLSKSKWHSKPREQEKALEKAYLHPAILESFSIPSFMK